LEIIEDGARRDWLDCLGVSIRNDRNIRFDFFIVFRIRAGGGTIGIPSQLREECNAERSMVSIVGQSAPG
jgi:hypothetical protein